MSDRPESVFSQASRLKKYITSFAIFYCTFTLGMSISFLNPTILDFKSKFDSSVTEISKVFTISFAACIFGSLTGGFIIKILSRQVFVILMLSLVSIGLLTIPYAETVGMFFALASVLGFGAGAYNSAQVAWIIDIWRDEAGPFILAQNFAFSVGTLVPPLILGPYLAEDEDEGEMNGGSTSTTSEPYESKLSTPFTVGGCIVGVSIILQLALYICAYSRGGKKGGGANPAEIKEVEKERKMLEEAGSGKKGSIREQLVLLGLTTAVLAFYQGMENCTSQFIASFSHFADVGLSEKKSARVALMLQLGFATGRLIGIVLVIKIPPYILLGGNLVIMLGANVVLLVLGQTNVSWLWIGSISMGAGMSTAGPAVYAYIQKYLFITDRVASVLLVFCGVVGAVYPVIVGTWVESSPAVLIYVNFLSILMCVLTFAFLFYITRMRESKLKNLSATS